MTKEEFIKWSSSVHDNFYDYSKVEYKDKKTPVTIICPVHGEFHQSPKRHLYGKGCPECVWLKIEDVLVRIAVCLFFALVFAGLFAVVWALAEVGIWLI